MFLISFLLLLAFCGPALANNVAIANVSLAEPSTSDQTVKVEFDISWENAWRSSVSHDAVWVFLKYSTDSGSTWSHATLQTAGTNPSGTSTGSGSSLQIVVPTDKVGAFISKSDPGQGDISTTDLQFVWDWGTDGVSSSATAIVRVFAIEMIYVPTGSFYLGDGNNTNESTNAFHDGTTNQNVQITTTLVSDIRVDTNANDDSQLENTGIGIDGDGGIDSDDDTTIDNADFPTGYNAFYIMKYELSHSQYRDFLNTLTQAQQNTRVTSDLSNENDANTYVMIGEATLSHSARQVIKAGSNPSDGDPYTFGADYGDNDTLDETSDGEWIAMGYLSWMDLAAYADWAGLRPMTELEYEKAARGPTAAVYQEYAWGTTSVNTSILSFAVEGLTTEWMGGFETGAGNSIWQTPAAALGGPVRVGSITYSVDQVGYEINREHTGASHYGLMELSGNLEESYVTVGHSTGRAFDGSHGDGVLTTTSSYEGNATNTGWPGIDGTAARGVTGAAGSGQRGGAYDDSSSGLLSVSDRTGAAAGVSTRTASFGARLGRTAP